MSKPLTDSDVKQLLRLDVVDDIINGRISYSPEFRAEAVQRWQNGETPQEIFRSKGLDPALIGRKRIERCMSRWTEGLTRKTVRRVKTKSSRPTYQDLKKQVQKMKLENVMLKVKVEQLQAVLDAMENRKR
ncbi:HTH domain-containing protein [Bifidobacterium callitrichidarum]|uniref:Uncharacterized protein n=1 Tax=Bifidobacterium callitrichidarum TaxID=2052941 RepID=A0A2U2N908_9BIFI|nr:HTH domain-containing protein [Bifidobacterium callitrichidarum]PWG65655.1 hypothetical protein DF196_06905 [Bifidobacterium callitrichidarum]